MKITIILLELINSTPSYFTQSVLYQLSSRSTNKIPSKIVRTSAWPAKCTTPPISIHFNFFQLYYQGDIASFMDLQQEVIFKPTILVKPSSTSLCSLFPLDLHCIINQLLVLGTHFSLKIEEKLTSSSSS